MGDTSQSAWQCSVTQVSLALWADQTCPHWAAADLECRNVSAGWQSVRHQTHQTQGWGQSSPPFLSAAGRGRRPGPRSQQTTGRRTDRRDRSLSSLSLSRYRSVSNPLTTLTAHKVISLFILPVWSLSLSSLSKKFFLPITVSKNKLVSVAIQSYN